MSQPRSRGTRSSLPAPSNVTLGAVVAVIAIVLGFFVLRNINADSGPTTDPGTNVTDTTGAEGEATTTTSPDGVTQTTGLVITGFKIQVANASGVAGSAGSMTVQMQTLGYVVQPAVNVSAGSPKRAKTGVFYLAGCEAAAQNVAETLGGNVEVGAMPSPVPLETGTLKEACVLILLGTDLSNKELAGAATSGNGAATPQTTAVPLPATTTTVAPTTTAG
jgi:LytR cell envelope-related transcriptional attenuator